MKIIGIMKNFFAKGEICPRCNKKFRLQDAKGTMSMGRNNLGLLYWKKTCCFPNEHQEFISKSA